MSNGAAHHSLFLMISVPTGEDLGSTETIIMSGSLRPFPNLT